MDSRTSSIAGLRELFEDYRKCDKCSLHETCRSRLRGFGDPKADVLVLVDKPTERDDRTGDLLTEPHGGVVFSALGDAHKSVWFSTTVLCPTPDARDPKVRELKACSERLHREIHLINPNVIIGLGNMALKALILKSPPSLSSVMGRMIPVKVQGDLVHYEVPAMFTYSLGHLVRNQDTTIGGLWNRFFSHIDRALLVSKQLNELRQK